MVSAPERTAGESFVGDEKIDPFGEDPISRAVYSPPTIADINVTDAQVYGVLAPRGRGKSLLASYLCGDMVRKRPGLQVFHNGPLNFGTRITLSQLVRLNEQLQNSIIFIDEAHELFDPLRASSTAQYLLTHMLQQIRKRNVWIIWAAQKERMVTPRLIEQTDFAIFVTGGWRRWQPLNPRPQHMNSRLWAPRCKNRLGDHPYCWRRPWKKAPGYDRNFTVRAKWVAQENSRLPTGFTIMSTLHCAHRFMPLFDTKNLIDPMEFLGLTSDKIKAEAQLDISVQVGQLINELLEQGIRKVTSTQFAIYLAQRHGHKLSPREIGAMLREWGAKEERTASSRTLVLKPAEVHQLQEA